MIPAPAQQNTVLPIPGAAFSNNPVV